MSGKKLEACRIDVAKEADVLLKEGHKWRETGRQARQEGKRNKGKRPGQGCVHGRDETRRDDDEKLPPS